MQFFKKTTLFIAVALLTTVMHSQNSVATDPAFAFIQALLGHWQGKATLKTQGQSMSFAYSADFRKTADGAGVVMDEQGTIPGAGTLKGANLIGFDAQDSKVHWYTVDNMGTTHEHIGELKSPTQFVMVHRSKHGSQDYVETVTMDRRDKHTLHLHLVATLDGKVDQDLEADFKH